jgi:hypothetical protein
MGVVSRDPADWPVVRKHHAGPRLSRQQGITALTLGLQLQTVASSLDEAHAAAVRRARRRRAILVAVTVTALAVLVAGGAFAAMVRLR